MSKTPLSQFNDTVRLFIGDLKNIFGENDRDIMRIEILLDMMKLNARLVIVPFQKSICQNAEFVRRIMREDREYFVQYPFEDICAVNTNEFYMKLVHKFREAIIMQGTNKTTLTAVFNWFKILIFHAYADTGIDANRRMREIAEAEMAMT